uniref:Uncharacterized protein n=1 Tax=Populus trichocarpa TaxID=3694 RepID=A0A3N7FRV9_POPTR
MGSLFADVLSIFMAAMKVSKPALFGCGRDKRLRINCDATLANKTLVDGWLKLCHDCDVSMGEVSLLLILDGRMGLVGLQYCWVLLAVFSKENEIEFILLLFKEHNVCRC